MYYDPQSRRTGPPDEGNFQQAFVFGSGVFIIVLLIFYAMSAFPLTPAAGTLYSTTEWPPVFAAQNQTLTGYCQTTTVPETGVTTLVPNSCVTVRSSDTTTIPIDEAMNLLLESESDLLPVRMMGESSATQ